MILSEYTMTLSNTRSLFVYQMKFHRKKSSIDKDRSIIHIQLMASMTWAYFWLLLSDVAKSNPVRIVLQLYVISSKNMLVLQALF